MKLNDILLESTTASIPSGGVVRPIVNGAIFYASSSEVFIFRVGSNNISNIRDAISEATTLKDQWQTRSNRNSLRRQYRSFIGGSRILPGSGSNAARVARVDQINATRHPKAYRLLNSRAFRVFGGLLSAFLVSEQLRYAMVTNIATFEEEAVNGDITQAEFFDKVQVAWGLYAIEVSAVMLATLAVAANRLRVIRAIRNVVRLGQLAVAGTGVGFVPSLISAVVTEVGFQALMYAVTNPAVQRAIVDWIVEWGNSTLIGGIVMETVQGAGAAYQAASAELDAVTGGLLGSENAFASSGAAAAAGFTDPGALEVAGVSGDAYATAEWARLVFQDLLFPPGFSLEARRVPYFTRGQREIMMAEDFGALTDVPSENEQPLPTGPQNGRPNNNPNREEPESVNSGGPGFRPGQ